MFFIKYVNGRYFINPLIMRLTPIRPFLFVKHQVLNWFKLAMFTLFEMTVIQPKLKLVVNNNIISNLNLYSVV